MAHAENASAPGSDRIGHGLSCRGHGAQSGCQAVGPLACRRYRAGRRWSSAAYWINPMGPTGPTSPPGNGSWACGASGRTATVLRASEIVLIIVAEGGPQRGASFALPRPWEKLPKGIHRSPNKPDAQGIRFAVAASGLHLRFTLHCESRPLPGAVRPHGLCRPGTSRSPAALLRVMRTPSLSVRW